MQNAESILKQTIIRKKVPCPNPFSSIDEGTTSQTIFFHIYRETKFSNVLPIDCDWSVGAYSVQKEWYLCTRNDKQKARGCSCEGFFAWRFVSTNKTWSFSAIILYCNCAESNFRDSMKPCLSSSGISSRNSHEFASLLEPTPHVVFCEHILLVIVLSCIIWMSKWKTYISLRNQ